MSSKSVHDFSSFSGPVFTKGLSQGLGLKLRLLSQVSDKNCLDFCLSVSGIHKEFKTGLGA